MGEPPGQWLRTDAGVAGIHVGPARRSCLELRHPAELPSTENLPCQIGLTLEERQFVKIIDRDDVAGIECRWAPQIVCIVENGEQAIYWAAGSGQSGDCFSVIARVSSLRKTGFVLVIAGATGEGTEQPVNS